MLLYTVILLTNFLKTLYVFNTCCKIYEELVNRMKDESELLYADQ